MRAAVLLMMAAVGFAAGPVKVVRKATPEKALIFEVEIPAPRTAVLRICLEGADGAGVELEGIFAGSGGRKSRTG